MSHHLHALRKELIRLLQKESLAIHSSEDIRLSSGRDSKYYVNVKSLLLTQDGVRVVGALLAQELQGVNFKAIGGPEVGGLLAAHAFAEHQDRLGRPMFTFFARKESKGYGIKANQPVEHPRGLRPGDNVVVIDDVVTSGASLLKALDFIEDAGFHVVKIMAVLDRKEGGTEKIVERGYAYSYLVTLQDLIETQDEYSPVKAVA